MAFETMKDSLREALDVFNSCDTAHEVADVLRMRKIKGVPVRSNECPVARYMQSSLPPDSSLYIDVGYHTVKIWAGGEGYGELPMPLIVGDFIRRFDQGQYPDLDDQIRRL
jgi:hypothetical protein